MDANARTWKAMAREYRGILQRGVDITEQLFSWHDEDQMKIKELHAGVARLREALEVLWGAYIGTGIEDDQPYVFCEHCLEPAPASAQLQHMDNCPFAALSTPADDSCEQWRFNDLIAAVTREQGASDE